MRVAVAFVNQETLAMCQRMAASLKAEAEKIEGNRTEVKTVSIPFSRLDRHVAHAIFKCISWLKIVVLCFKFRWSLFLRLDWWRVGIGLSNGLVSNGPQAITWACHEPDYWHCITTQHQALMKLWAGRFQGCLMYLYEYRCWYIILF